MPRIAVECAEVGEVDLTILERHIDDLELESHGSRSASGRACFADSLVWLAARSVGPPS